jgi:hypothetical protein
LTEPDISGSALTLEDNVMKRMLTILLLAVMIGFTTNLYAVDGDKYNDGSWRIPSNGNLLPVTDSAASIGASGTEVAMIYADSLTVGGAVYTSFAAGTDGNWTGNGTTTTLDAAPTKFIATHSSGNFQATQIGVGTSGILGATNAQTITFETNNAFIFGDNSDTATMTFTGDDVSLDASDGGYIFALTDATNGTVDIQANNDTDDYIEFSTAANVPHIKTAGTSNLHIEPDGGTVAVTGILTVSGATTSTGILTATAGVTLENAETVTNATNGTITLSGANTQIVDILAAGTSNEDATLSLSADAAADNGDVWRLTSDGATNSLFFENNTSGSQATILTLAANGVLTTTAGINVNVGAITLADEEEISNVSDAVIITADDAGATLRLLGYESSASTLQLYADQDDDATDGWQIQSTTAGTLTVGNDSTAAGTAVTLLTLDKEKATLSSASDNASINITGYEAKEAQLRLNADQDDDATDGWEIASSTAGTLTIGNDSSAAGTYVDKFTMSSAGVITLVDGETITNASDVVTIGADDAAASLVVSGFEGSASAITIQADEGDDAADKFIMSMSAANAFTMTTGSTEAISIATTGTSTLAAATITGAFAANGTIGLGNAIGDIVTVTGKVAGATPLSFDGNTADSVYTIIAVDDPASSSKTVTIPAVTGTVKLTGAAVALTPASAVTLTVAKGTTLYTLTPTDNEDETITFSGAGSAGDEATIIVTSTGAGDEVLTFHATLCSSTGTLTMGTTAAHYMVIRFISDGSKWHEVSRTADQT